MASLKNAVVKLRNLTPFRKKSKQEERNIRKQIRTIDKKGFKRLVEALHVPLLSCCVPQLHVNLLCST